MIEIEHTVEAAGFHVIEVKDNGIGFDDDYKDKIFGLFQRLHGRAKFSGSGLGLAIVRKVLERHGGSIEAHGDPGKGASFTLMIPRSRE